MACIPDRGQLIGLTFNPRAGHEQSGPRPALAFSPATYNGKAGLVLVCPVTRQQKGYPFEVLLPSGLPVSGVVLADQLRSLDGRVREAALICRAPDTVVAEALAKASALLQAL